MPEDVYEQAIKELRRLERMGDQTGESGMIRTYLDWLIAIPWNKRSDEHLDPVEARKILDADHAGLDDVKDRVTEYLAVRKLRDRARDRGRSEVWRDPHARRSSRHRQNVDRAVDRAGARP